MVGQASSRKGNVTKQKIQKASEKFEAFSLVKNQKYWICHGRQYRNKLSKLARITSFDDLKPEF